jgi:hypothetical protein
VQTPQASTSITTCEGAGTGSGAETTSDRRGPTTWLMSMEFSFVRLRELGNRLSRMDHKWLCSS